MALDPLRQKLVSLQLELSENKLLPKKINNLAQNRILFLVGQTELAKGNES